MTKTDQTYFTRLDAWLAALIGLVSLALYWRTLAPGLLFSDSGEFQTLAYLLGNTHPTGYPVYLLLAKPFTWLPVADIAYRVNLFSAVMASLTVVEVYLAGRLLTRSSWLALVGALALAVSPTFWSQALIAEVYTPGAACLAAVLLSLLLWQATASRRALFAAALFGGLSLGVHLTVALLAPAALVVLLLKSRNRLADLMTALAGAGVGLGLALIAFLILDWHAPPANYFNAVVNPSHSAWELEATDLDNPFERMMFGLGARQFRSMMFADPERIMFRQARAYWRELPDELSRPIIILAAVGLLSLLLRRFSSAMLFFLALAVHWVYTFNYTIWDIYVFYIPGYVLLTLLAIAGMDGLVEAASRLADLTGFGRWGWLWPRAVELLLVLIILITGVWPTFAPRWGGVIEGRVSFDFNGYPIDEEILELLHPGVTTIVQSLEQNAIVFTDWDALYPLYYAAHIEQGRTDLTFIETFPHSEGEGLAESTLAYVQAHLVERPVYFFEPVSDLRAAGYSFSPVNVGPIELYQLQP